MRLRHSPTRILPEVPQARMGKMLRAGMPTRPAEYQVRYTVLAAE